MIRNREADVLAGTFRDKLSVCRTRRVRDPETEGTVEKEVTVYEEIPCALSQKANDTPQRQEFHSEKKQTHMIFTPPGIELLDKDRAVVVTEAGQRFTGTTGRTFGYISHGETAFTAEDMA